MTVNGSGRQLGSLPIPADHHLAPGTHRCKLTLFCEHLPIGDIHLPILPIATSGKHLIAGGRNHDLPSAQRTQWGNRSHWLNASLERPPQEEAGRVANPE